MIVQWRVCIYEALKSNKHQGYCLLSRKWFKKTYSVYFITHRFINKVSSMFLRNWLCVQRSNQWPKWWLTFSLTRCEIKTKHCLKELGCLRLSVYTIASQLTSHACMGKFCLRWKFRQNFKRVVMRNQCKQEVILHFRISHMIFWAFYSYYLVVKSFEILI